VALAQPLKLTRTTDFSEPPTSGRTVQYTNLFHERSDSDHQGNQHATTRGVSSRTWNNGNENELVEVHESGNENELSSRMS